MQGTTYKGAREAERQTKEGESTQILAGAGNSTIENTDKGDGGVFVTQELEPVRETDQ